MRRVVDRFSNKIIPLKFDFKDTDTLDNIKKKVFVSYNLDENFITPEIMAISNGKNYITSENDIKNSKDLSSLVVFNLINEITDYVLKNINIFISGDISSPTIDKLFVSLKKSYTSLTKEDLLLVVEYILSKHVNLDFKDEIKIWGEKSRSLQKEIEKYLKTVYNDKGSTTDNISKDIILAGKNEEEGEFIYSLINSNVKFKISDENIDLTAIVKEYKLDSNVPLMFIKNPVTLKPIVKVYEKFPREQIKEWVKKTDADEIKSPKGLTFKLKTCNNMYSTVVISDEKNLGTRLSIRCGWVKDEKARVKDIKDCYKNLNKVIKKINSIFPGKDISLGEPKVSFINFQFNTKKRVSLAKISSVVKNFKNVFKLEEKERKKEFVKLVYLPLNINVLIRNSEIQDGEQKIKANVISSSGVKNEKHIYSIIKDVGKLITNAEGQKKVIEFKDFQFIENTEEDEDAAVKVKKIEIKKLKEKGAPIDTKGCQTQRRPVISQTENALSGSYPLVFEGNRYICKNPDYKYPGFTAKNAICCFKKDQRDKDVYKRNVSENNVVEGDSDKISDRDIIKPIIIKSEKILEKNRLGVLRDYMYKIFDKEFLRLGVLQNKNSLLNCLNIAWSKSFSQDDIKDEEETSEIELLSNLFKTNIIIFVAEKGIIKCKEDSFMPFKKFVFVIKNNANYELIVLKESSSKLKKVFDRGDDISSKVLDIYKKSCIVKYSGFPDTPMTIVDILEKGIKVYGQITNDFKKTVYLETDIGLIPIIPFKTVKTIKTTTFKSAKLDADTQLDLLLKSKVTYLQPVGQILNKKGETSGIVTKSFLIVPVNDTKEILNLPVIYRQFDENIDNILFNHTPTTDKRFSYMLEVKFTKEMYERLKYTLSHMLVKYKVLRENIETILTKFKYKDQEDKINTLVSSLDLILSGEVIFLDKIVPKDIGNIRNVCSSLSIENCSTDVFCIGKEGCKLGIEKKIYKNFLKKLSLEMVWNKDIMEGKVKREFLDKNNFLKRKDEVVLLDDNDIKKYFMQE